MTITPFGVKGTAGMATIVRKLKILEYPCVVNIDQFYKCLNIKV